MNIRLFFFIFASVISLLSIITICISPNINGFNDHEWRGLNCQPLKDQYDYDKNRNYISNEDKDKTLKADKKELNKCKRHKGMYDLEYTSLIIDLIFGVFISFLGLLHCLDVGKQFEKNTGIIGLSFGIIGFVLTIIYAGFSGYIFNNEPSKQKLLFPNGAVVKKDGSHYVSVFNQKLYDDNVGDPDDDDDENNNIDPDLYIMLNLKI
jgi:amino acid transporter